MSRLDRLLEVGTMTQSLGVYVPAMALGRAFGLLRHTVFLYLIASSGEFGLWTLGAMIFNIGAQLVTLGSNHGLIRYVSFYEARGQLQAFYRRIRWAVLLACLVLTAAALLGTDKITAWVFASRADQRVGGFAEHRLICLAAIGNMLVMALYVNLLSFLYGMRVYRLAALVELAAGVLFTLLGVGALWVHPTGLAILGAHAAATALTLVAGLAVVHGGLSRLGRAAVEAARQAVHERQVVLTPPADDDGAGGAMKPAVAAEAEAPLAGRWAAERRVFRFGIITLASALLLQALPYVSLVMIQRAQGETFSGVYGGLMRYTQPFQFIGATVLMVVFSHVARLWETGRQRTAASVLETSYGALVLGLMTLAVVAYAAAPLWLRILPSAYWPRDAVRVVGGQLICFQTLTHLGLMTIVARLRERPIVMSVMAVAAAGANVLLGHWWIADMGLPGAALAAGVGILVGGGTVSVLYLMAGGVSLRPVTYLFLAAPAVLLLPPWLAGAVWVGVLMLAVFTNLLLTRRQKDLIRAELGKTWRAFRSVLPWR